MEANKTADIMIVLILIGIVWCGYYFYTHNFIHVDYSFSSFTEESLLKSCNNLSLKETVSCVTTFEKKIYIPRMTDDNTNQTFVELKKNGGDCRDWSNWEQSIYTRLGFFSGVLPFPLEEWKAGKNYTDGHQITYVVTNNSRCYIDNLNYWCGSEQ